MRRQNPSRICSRNDLALFDPFGHRPAAKGGQIDGSKRCILRVNRDCVARIPRAYAVEMPLPFPILPRTPPPPTVRPSGRLLIAKPGGLRALGRATQKAQEATPPDARAVPCRRSEIQGSPAQVLPEREGQGSPSQVRAERRGHGNQAQLRAERRGHGNQAQVRAERSAQGSEGAGGRVRLRDRGLCRELERAP